MSERLMVIGSDAAGMSAASQARRRRGPGDLEILAFERGHYTSFSACGIPYYVAGVVPEPEALIARTPETFRSKFSVDVRLRHEVTQIDLDKRAAQVLDLETGRHWWEGFDQLVIATGAVPKRLPLPGSEAAGIHGVQVLDDGTALRRALETERPRRAVIVGGGYIGVEMAEALTIRGLEVTLVDSGPQPMRQLDPDMGARVTDALCRLGVTVLLEEPVEGFASSGGRVEAVVTRERTIPTGLVVLGLGVRPNVDLAEQAGVPLGPSGGIATDRRMHTPVEGVWSAGDCVESFHLVSRKPVVIALGTHANKQGRVAGINIGGGYATFPGVLGTVITKVCGVEIARTGLNERETREAGLDCLCTTVRSTTRAGYYPGAKPMWTRIIAEKRSGRLLGAQIVGEEGAAKRIDVLAVALHNGMTVEELTSLDLSYAPPFSPVWDPVLIAARKSWELVEEGMLACK